MILLNWYSYSASVFFYGIEHLCNRAFHLIQRIGWIPDVFYISLLCVLFITWFGIMRKYDRNSKDKGIIE